MDRVKDFLRKNWDGKSPLLLGYSGGFDSKALFHLLLEMKVTFHVAHVDHGWRKESREEAENLKSEAVQLGVPFHTIQLVPDPSESAAREKRLEFFKTLFEKIPFQALLLGHQADDLAETALKRVLEGAHLVHLGGMRGVSRLGELPVWRPMLQVPRKEILAYLARLNIAALNDSTNLNPIYLRGRMRSQIFPELSLRFGKEISPNLTHLANQANDLKEYLDRKTEAAFQILKKGPYGLMLPPSLEEPMEIRHLLQRTKIKFSRPILESLVDAIAKQLPNRRFGERLIADRGYFFYLAENFPKFGEKVPVQEGIYRFGDWKIEVVRSQELKTFEWIDFWHGNFSLSLPLGDYQIEGQKGLMLRKMLNEKQIPAFLRPHAPHICQNGKPVLDLLSGRRLPGGCAYQVRFSVDTTC